MSLPARGQCTQCRARQTPPGNCAQHASINGTLIVRFPWIPTTAVILFDGEHASSQAAVVSSLASVPVTVPAVPLPFPRPPDTGAQAPAMDAFGGVPEPVAGNLGTRRAASSARSLPPPGPFAAQFLRHHGARTPYPNRHTAGLPVPKPDVDVVVVCWPMLPHDSDYEPLGYPTPKIKVKNNLAKLYADRLDSHHLICRIKVPADRKIPPAEFSGHITTHLQSHGLSMPPRPTDVDIGNPDDLHSQPFILLKSSVKNGVYILNQHPGINDNLFTSQEFLKLNRSFPNPMTGPDSSHPWIWITPRYGHISGPVEGFSTSDQPLSGTHPCFGLRIVDTLPASQAASRNEPLDPECYDGYCPTIQIAPILSGLLNGSQLARPITPPPQPSLIRQRSPQSQSSHRRMDFASPAVFRLQPARLRIGSDILPLTAIVDWREAVETHVTALPSVGAAGLVFIHGRTVSSVAKCILDLLVYLQKPHDPDDTFVMEDRTVQLDEILRCKTEDLAHESFLKPVRGVQMTGTATTRAITQGIGPERAAWREACSELGRRHHYWQPAASSTMLRPIFTPGDMAIPDRIQTFRGHGMFLALHCFLLGQGPLPISIWLLLCLIEGPDTLIIPQNTLLHIDPGAYEILAPWYDFEEHTPMPPANEASHPLRLFILEHMPGVQVPFLPYRWLVSKSLQPNLISNNRTAEEHHHWVRAAFSTVLLGHASPWRHPEYIALQEGFNAALGNMNFAEVLAVLPDVLLLTDEQTLRSANCLNTSAFLVSIYDRRVHNVEEVADHLQFFVIGRALNLTTPYFAALFRLRLKRYIHGHGHPPELYHVIEAFGVSQAEAVASRSDPLLRANLILRCGSDGDLRPSEDNWKITFNFEGRTARDSDVATPLGFHTCFNSITVFVDHALQKMLMEPVGTDDSKGSKFDLWLHEQLVNPDHNTELLSFPPPCLPETEAQLHRAEEVAELQLQPPVRAAIPPEPDNPRAVTMFPTADGEGSESDGSSDHPFSQAQNSDPEDNVQTRESSVEILGLRAELGRLPERSSIDGPNVHGGLVMNIPDSSTETEFTRLADDPAVYRAEMEFMRQVDERVEMLIAEIHRLEGRSTTPEPLPSAMQSESPTLVIDMDDDSTAIYFVGVHALQGRRTFVEVVQTASPDHTIIERLSTGLLGRMLATIRADQANFYVGTSHTPIDVSGDYMNHVHTFRELGGWSDMEDGNSSALSMLTPVPASAERTAVLTRCLLHDPVPVYVLYIYHAIQNSRRMKDAQSMWDEAAGPVVPTALSALPPASDNITPVSVPATRAPSASDDAISPAEAYVKEHFAQRLERIRHVHELACGTAYRHCTEEKNVIAICNTLGLANNRGFSPVVLHGIRIAYEDVVCAAGLKKNTLGGVRTQVGKAREARRTLARTLRLHDGTWTAANEAEAALEMRRRDVFETFSALLREGDIADSFLEDATDSAEARALRLSYEDFKTDIADVLGGTL
ncbi:hypothetical protein K438DRAFT_1782182 [Mycena galopus ATCC 62051]|nr:hypothetical protein K438DRAFT_1782182 [Mycena galopus ATCC 62051]